MDALIQYFGIITGVGAAIPATWKFFAWLKDRSDKSRIESAAAFNADEAQDWQRDLARSELLQIHFRRLTGIETREGHQALFDLHARLGKGFGHWQLIKGAQPYIETVNNVAQVRKLDVNDYGKQVLALVIGLIFCCAGVWLVEVVGAIGIEQLRNENLLKGLSFLSISVVYAALSFLSAWLCFSAIHQAYVAIKLRRKLDLLTSR